MYSRIYITQLISDRRTSFFIDKSNGVSSDKRNRLSFRNGRRIEFKSDVGGWIERRGSKVSVWDWAISHVERIASIFVDVIVSDRSDSFDVYKQEQCGNEVIVFIIVK